MFLDRCWYKMQGSRLREPFQNKMVWEKELRISTEPNLHQWTRTSANYHKQFGHIVRAGRLTPWLITGHYNGRRERGRPHTTWLQSNANILGTSKGHCIKRAITAGVLATHTGGLHVMQWVNEWVNEWVIESIYYCTIKFEIFAENDWASVSQRLPLV